MEPGSSWADLVIRGCGAGSGHRLLSMVVAGIDFDMVQLDELCRRYGVARLEVFGSMARGDGSRESDLDLLYELAPGATLGWEIMELEAGLGELFGRPVDLVSKRSLHRHLRPAVLAEARELYAA